LVDKIIVLDEGRVVESGSHGELLNTDGAYAKMWKEQLRTVESESASEISSQ
jgi:ABC-type multidrug transport system fused ATPase/permease subunit